MDVPLNPTAAASAQGLLPRLFLSYSRANLYLAQLLHADLVSAGLDCWIDTRDLSSLDANWRLSIESAITSADQVLWLVSPESLLSDEVEKELQIAALYGKPIRHLSLVPIHTLPRELRNCPQLTDWSCRCRHYRSLLQDLIMELCGTTRSENSDHPLDVLRDPGKASALSILEHAIADDFDLPPFWRLHWLDVSPYTCSWLVCPAADAAHAEPPSELGIVLRFSGRRDRNTLRDVLAQRRDDQMPGWVVYIQGPKTRDGEGFHLPIDAPHHWLDSVEVVVRLLNYTGVQRLPLSLYLDAPAVLAMRIGQRLAAERPIRFCQFNRQTSRYQAIELCD